MHDGKRWEHQRGRILTESDEGVCDDYGFIQEPGLLPIGTDDWPDREMKEAEVHEYSIAPVFAQYGTNMSTLLKETVMQRLHRGIVLAPRGR